MPQPGVDQRTYFAYPGIAARSASITAIMSVTTAMLGLLITILRVAITGTTFECLPAHSCDCSYLNLR
jgi:hypothetical protein